MRIFIVFPLLLLLTTCKHDNVEPSSCEDIEFKSSPYGPEITVADITYHSPCFNPDNSNEIIYVKKDNNTGKAELRKRNLQTKADIYLAESWVLYTPSWNKIGWIVFDHRSSVFKIKDNGDSLIKLTSGEEIHSPVWTPDGKDIIFFKYDQTDWGVSVFDNNGENRRLLEQGKLLYPIQFSPDGKKICSGGYTDVLGTYLSLYDTLTKDQQVLKELDKPRV